MSKKRSQKLESCTGVLTIEIDSAVVERGFEPPPPISRHHASALADLISADLRRLLGPLERLTLVVPGALYDQTELLRPGFPIPDALEAVARGTLRHGRLEPQLIALGVDQGESFPIAALQPKRPRGAGPMLLLPFTFVGDREDIEPLRGTMENTLLHQGVVSKDTLQLIQDVFALETLHLSYATLADLCALLNVQLENAGLLPLWSLLETGFLGSNKPKHVELPEGNVFVSKGNRVYSPFYTFDVWALVGPGRNLTDDLALHYSEWTQIQRQYLMALAAYGFEIHQVPATGPVSETLRMTVDSASGNMPSDVPWHCELVFGHQDGEGIEQVQIVDQFDQRVGTIAYTVDSLDSKGTLLRRENFYPLRPEGLDGVIEFLVKRTDALAAERMVHHPEALIYDAVDRKLCSLLSSAPEPTSVRH